MINSFHFTEKDWDERQLRKDQEGWNHAYLHRIQYTYIVTDAFVVFVLCLNVDGELWQERALKKRTKVKWVKLVKNSHPRKYLDI